MATIGIDTHKATLAVSVIDATGRGCGARTFPNDHEGHVTLLHWVQGLAAERRFGIEGSGSFGAVLARLLVAAGEHVVEVPAVLTDRERRHLRRAGKSDPGDALAIARVALREAGLGPISMPGIAEDLKLLVDARDQRVGERTRVANRLHANLVVLVAGYKRMVPNLASSSHRAALAGLLEDLVGVRADLARADLARLLELDAECTALAKRIRSLVRLSGSSLPTITGVAAITAAKLLGETGDPRRIRSTPAFAAMSGTAPIPASSGQTSRHRLNRGGNRQLNRALHTIALVQARTDPLADVVLRTMLADVERSAEPVTLGT